MTVSINRSAVTGLVTALVSAVLEFGRADPVDLQGEGVVLVGLADPLHPEPAGGGDRPGVVRASDREQFVDLALVERPANQGPARLGGVAMTPGVRAELP